MSWPSGTRKKPATDHASSSDPDRPSAPEPLPTLKDSSADAERWNATLAQLAVPSGPTHPAFARNIIPLKLMYRANVLHLTAPTGATRDLLLQNHIGKITSAAKSHWHKLIRVEIHLSTPDANGRQ